MQRKRIYVCGKGRLDTLRVSQHLKHGSNCENVNLNVYGLTVFGSLKLLQNMRL